MSNTHAQNDVAFVYVYIYVCVCVCVYVCKLDRFSMAELLCGYLCWYSSDMPQTRIWMCLKLDFPHTS